MFDTYPHGNDTVKLESGLKNGLQPLLAQIIGVKTNEKIKKCWNIVQSQVTNPLKGEKIEKPLNVGNNLKFKCIAHSINIRDLPVPIMGVETTKLRQNEGATLSSISKVKPQSFVATTDAYCYRLKLFVQPAYFE